MAGRIIEAPRTGETGRPRCKQFEKPLLLAITGGQAASTAILAFS